MHLFYKKNKIVLMQHILLWLVTKSVRQINTTHRLMKAVFCFNNLNPCAKYYGVKVFSTSDKEWYCTRSKWGNVLQAKMGFQQWVKSLTLVPTNSVNRRVRRSWRAADSEALCCGLWCNTVTVPLLACWRLWRGEEKTNNV